MTDVQEEAPEAEVKENRSRIRFESSLSREEAISYFEAIVNGLKNGKLTLRQQGEAVALTPQERVEVEVRAESRADKERLRFALEWRKASSSDLTITAE